jgi:hypothetical protein
MGCGVFAAVVLWSFGFITFTSAALSDGFRQFSNVP